MNNKTEICLIGPFPPPINGNSLALQTIYDSNILKSNYYFYRLNLSANNKEHESIVGKIIRYLRLTFKLIVILRKNKNIKIVYITVAQSFWGNIRDIIFIIISFKKKKKVIIHLHGGYFRKYYENSSYIIKRINKQLFKKISCAIVLSNNLKKIYDGLVEKDKIKIVENCIQKTDLLDIDLISKKIKQAIEIKQVNILYLSNLIETKGYKDLLKAAKLLKLYYEDNLKFNFAGAFYSENDKKFFYNYIEKNKLSNIITYHGIVKGEKKLELLKNNYIFVLPSYYPNEGQPIAIIEAMASAMAIITTRHAGIPDMVRDNINGIFVQKKSYKDIAEAVNKLCKDRELLKEIIKNNRVKVEENYLEEYYIKKIYKIFKDVLYYKEHRSNV